VSSEAEARQPQGVFAAQSSSLKQSSYEQSVRHPDSRGDARPHRPLDPLTQSPSTAHLESGSGTPLGHMFVGSPRSAGQATLEGRWARGARGAASSDAASPDASPDASPASSPTWLRPHPPTVAAPPVARTAIAAANVPKEPALTSKPYRRFGAPRKSVSSERRIALYGTPNIDATLRVSAAATIRRMRPRQMTTTLRRTRGPSRQRKGSTTRSPCQIPKPSDTVVVKAYSEMAVAPMNCRTR
jgi:hypothetical protein